MPCCHQIKNAEYVCCWAASINKNICSICVPDLACILLGYISLMQLYASTFQMEIYSTI